MRINCEGFTTAEKKLLWPIQIIRFFFDLTVTLTIKRYDVVFVRNAYHFLFIFLLCWILRVKIQLEINTKEREEFLNRGQRLRAWINSISFFLACRCAERIHAVTPEIMDHYKLMCPRVPIVFNPNFVVDEQYINSTAVGEDRFTQLVFLGNTNQPWQGLFEFIQNVAIGNSWMLENCRLHIVGVCGDDIKGLIQENALQESIIMHGYLQGEAKRQVMSKMHIGIGVFNMGMKSMRQATPIKIGEYFFAGLPVIIGYEDPRLPNKSDIPMWLQIDVFSANDLHHRVNMFIKDVRHNGLARESVHEYAKAHMLVKNYIDKILQ